ncbi:MAG TPA: DUF177 domain-containing protein [Coriobacteriia bacterium]
MSYRTTVRGVLESLASSRTVTGEITAPDVELGAQAYRFDGPLTFEVELTYAGAGVVAQGTVSADVITPCSRCLCDAHLTVSADVDGFYVMPGHESGLPEEQEFEFIADDMSIDLEPAVLGSLVMELPFAPLHDEDCLGICPTCGRDRNIDPCGCESPSTSSPFETLRDLHLKDTDTP